MSTFDHRRHRDEQWQDYIERQFEQLHGRITSMTDALAGIAADEQAIATAITNVTTYLQTLQSEIVALQQKLTEAASQGTTVDPAELATIQAGLDQQVTALQALTPAAPAPSPTNEPPAPGTEPTQPTASVYTFSGEGTPDPGVWPPSGYETEVQPGGTEAPQLLYYFSGDTAPGETNGNGQPGWTLYTGTAIPVPATS